ncbi:hypothetical protein B296_00032909 [Ensete ventricosum]|uniref:Uncharacterized protein n=1 Tax=Ensete ventricosum TaxID=4639 RepID=A0A426ZLC9_ENSVE|nr:hypothetical protein B296_00032909 [Ensete ventricosum]
MTVLRRPRVAVAKPGATDTKKMRKKKKKWSPLGSDSRAGGGPERTAQIFAAATTSRSKEKVTRGSRSLESDAPLASPLHSNNSLDTDLAIH